MDRNSCIICISDGNYINWEIKMMDIKGTYLSLILDEEIYMAQPDHLFLVLVFYHFIVHQVEPMMDFTCFTLKTGGQGDAAQGR